MTAHRPVSGGPSGPVDVVVAGGGPAGAVAALILARAGRRVELLDDGGQGQGHRRAAASGPAVKTGEVKIGEFLPPAARPLLSELELLDGFLAAGHPISTGTYAAWGSTALHGRSHLFDPYGHGWHLDRLRFDAFLREAAVAAGARLRRATVLDQRSDRLIVREQPTGVITELSARWTIDATGRRCVIGRRHGHRQRQDRLVAAYAVFPSRPMGDPADAEARTLVEAAERGWWYTTRIPAGRLVAHLTDADLADPSLRTRHGFWHALSRTVHVRRRLAGHGPAATPVPRWAPAHGLRLTPAAGPGWVAAGDAALAFDPLSSQGILTALHTGAHAGRTVTGCLSDEWHTTAALADYTAFLDGIAAAYQRNHAYAYNQEQRWPLSPFWRRRRKRAERPGSA